MARTHATKNKRTNFDVDCFGQSLLELCDVELGRDDGWLRLWAAGAEMLEGMVHHTHGERPQKHMNSLKRRQTNLS